MKTYFNSHRWIAKKDKVFHKKEKRKRLNFCMTTVFLFFLGLIGFGGGGGGGVGKTYIGLLAPF